MFKDQAAGNEINPGINECPGLGNISLPVILPPGGAGNFTVAFIPTIGGLKNGTINILNDNCVKTTYDFVLRGTGVLLVPVLGTYPPTSIPAGGNILVSPTAAPVNAQNITAYTSARFKGLLSVDAATGKVYITNAHPAGIADFKRRFSVVLILSIPFLLLSEMIQTWLRFIGRTTS